MTNFISSLPAPLASAWHKTAGTAQKAWRWYKSQFQGRPWWRKTLAALASLIVAFVLYLGAVDLNLFWLFGESPGYFSGLADKRPAQASEIYSADGKLIGKFFSENRTPVEYGEVSPAFWNALIDTEDERYYQRPRGLVIDPIGMLAVAKQVVLHHDGRGASTITQQLAKNLFRVRSNYSTGLLGHVPGLSIIVMKSKEWVIGTKLETLYDKREIITMYANTVDFGSNAYGIKAAAKTYFNCAPRDLTPDQAAILVGMLKATSTYNPRLHPDKSLTRRNVVLGNMLAHGHLTREEHDTLVQKPIKLDYSVEKNYDGQAQYFRQAVADNLKDWCKENNIDLYTAGLKIHTTIDTRLQKYAEAAARKQMKVVQRNFNSHWGSQEPWQDERHNVIPHFIEDIAKRQPVYEYLADKYAATPDSIDYYLNLPHPVRLFDYEKGTVEQNISTLDSIRYMVRFMHCAFVAMEAETGHVKAWVGDIDFHSWKYDKVRAMRQPGSTFKLFVYTEAMNQGLTPCDKRRDERFAMQVYDAKEKKEVTWAPTNANGYFTGDSMPLKAAFARSINSVAVRLGQEMGIPRIVETAKQMGIKSPLDPTPSLALGSSDVTLLELTGAYCTVANGGRHHDPVLVLSVEDRDGKEIFRAKDDGEQVLPARSAFFVQQLLQGGLREPGATSMNLNGYIGDVRDTEFGGKTGTSNNHSDAWFVGVSPKLVTGAWVGGEYRCIHFRTGALGQGSRTALPICGLFLQDVMHDAQFQAYHAKFPKPADGTIVQSDYNCAPYRERAANDSLESDSAHIADIIIDDPANPKPQPELEEGEVIE